MFEPFLSVFKSPYGHLISMAVRLSSHRPSGWHTSVTLPILCSRRPMSYVTPFIVYDFSFSVSTFQCCKMRNSGNEADLGWRVIVAYLVSCSRLGTNSLERSIMRANAD